MAETAGIQLAVGSTLDDADELTGSVAADANHSEDAKTRQALDRTYKPLAKLDGE